MGQLRLHIHAPGEYILSGNAATLEYLAAQGEELYVKHVNTDEKYPLNCLDDDAWHEMEIKEVLNSIGLNTPMPPVTHDYSTAASQIQFTLEDRGNITDEISAIVLPGHLDEDKYGDAQIEDLIKENYLTQAPQTRKTTLDSIEYLSAFIPSTAKTDPTAILLGITAYLKDGTQLERSVSWDTAKDYPICVSRVDAKRVKSLLTSEQARQLEAWDVYMYYQGEGVFGRYAKVRYILKNGRSDNVCFAFVNDLGGLDTIHACGTKKTMPEYSINSFVSGGITSTLKTSPRTVFEAGSGPLATTNERNLWMAFLRSKEKYRLSPDGKFRAINMTESSPELIAGEISSISFKYIEDIENGGNAPEYTELEDYR